jgi:hypothetical protein
MASGVAVSLENQAYAVVATTATDARGFYTFDNLSISGTGFNVLFTQEQNEQYDVGEVVSWAWLGPITLSDGQAVELPDFEIGLRGLEQVTPASGASFSTADISKRAPLTFAWEPYAGASTYWVDLMEGDELITVWQSPLVSATSVAFDGTLDDGAHIAAGAYWWGVGARKSLGSYHLTVYGYLPALVITP